MRTIADLGRQLALLRLTAPRPTPAHEPLTLRELAQSTGIPRSTLGNAESGRVLPRANVVYRFAEGCGIPPDQIPLWTQARNRIAHAARYRRRENQFKAAQIVVERLAHHSERASLQAVFDFLSAESLDVTGGNLGKVLDALPSDRCTRYLADMPTEAAVECLHAMSPQPAAGCIEQLDTTVAATLLQAEDPAMAAEHLQLLGTYTVRQLLPRLPVPVLSQRLVLMPRHEAEILVAKMPADWTGSLIADTAVPVALAADLLFTLDHSASLRLIASLPISRRANLMAFMNADPAAGLLGGLSDSQLRETLAAIPDARASQIIRSLPHAKAVTLLSAISATDGAALLAELPPAAAADILIGLGPSPRTALLGAMTEPQRTEAAIALVPASIRQGPPSG
ncbi:magnesium transporter MgtE N-terminal domain-containing protein [Actinoplanes regularis]|uniref:magnesium transporter MgtE N-terminal domain-containing protein n=1 Tax=Actinoplanes regularis TaxID=52697 RepID=UPI0025568F72|nr:helix-turn-helix domain-containing protein [Actinoplanes regularis]GLW27900.1 hypothetical protein Areg01_08400 [Actinoplanes regularis]